MAQNQHIVSILDYISSDLWTALQGKGWSIQRIHPFEGGEVLGKIVENDILYVKPIFQNTSNWLVARTRVSHKMHGRAYWKLSPLSLQDAISAVEQLPELNPNISIHALTLDSLLEQYGNILEANSQFGR